LKYNVVTLVSSQLVLPSQFTPRAFLWQPIAQLPGSSLIVHFNFQ
jgi:hypothetical protein